MKAFTLKKFLAYTHIDSKLVRATVKQLGGLKSFEEAVDDICTHGAAGGYNGFTYYDDTISFTKHNKKAIFDFCRDEAKSQGYSGSLAEFVQTFNCNIDKNMEVVEDGLFSQNSEYQADIYNTLAWFILEEVARSFVSLKETLN